MVDMTFVHLIIYHENKWQKVMENVMTGESNRKHSEDKTGWKLSAPWVPAFSLDGIREIFGLLDLHVRIWPRYSVA